MSVTPVFDSARIERGRSLRLFTTLKAGGRAEAFTACRTRDELAAAAIYAQTHGMRTTVLGWGSNILPSDAGVPGFVLLNLASEIHLRTDGLVEVDAGTGFQDLWLKTAQANRAGLEFAVGIPGTVGGALVSNAGAYRSNVSEFLTELEVVREGRREWVSPDVMEFAYRDSVLRRPNPPQMVVLAARMRLPAGNPLEMYNEARDYQRQRIGKQPPSASAGSFFKNVYDQALADQLDNLPERLRSAGVVPAGYLIEQVGLKGRRYGGAMIGARHANFLLNVGGATATELRRLAEYAIAQVRERYHVTLEEEVLYLGDWSAWNTTGQLEP